MAAVITTTVRKFTFKEEELPDPDPRMSVNEVLDFYSGKYPELAAGIVSEPEDGPDGELIYDITYSVGNKA